MFNDIEGCLTFREWQVESGYVPLGMYDHRELEMYASYLEYCEAAKDEDENDETN